MEADDDREREKRAYSQSLDYDESRRRGRCEVSRLPDHFQRRRHLSGKFDDLPRESNQ